MGAAACARAGARLVPHEFTGPTGPDQPPAPGGPVGAPTGPTFPPVFFPPIRPGPGFEFGDEFERTVCAFPGANIGNIDCTRFGLPAAGTPSRVEPILGPVPLPETPPFTGPTTPIPTVPAPTTAPPPTVGTDPVSIVLDVLARAVSSIFVRGPLAREIEPRTTGGGGSILPRSFSWAAHAAAP